VGAESDKHGLPLMTRREAIKTVGKLATIALIGAVAPAIVQEYAQEEKDARLRDLLLRMVPGSATVKPVLGENDEALYYEAYDSSGMLVGYVFTTTVYGRNGPISLVGGVDLNYRVTGIEILSQSETPALGARIVEPQFTEQFVGLSTQNLELTTRGGRIHGITGATISSTAVTRAMREKIEEIRKTTS